jgi:hypothetical protein
MTTSPDSLSRMELFVLARLAGAKKPPTENDVAETLAKYGTPAASKGEWKPRVLETLQRLRDKELIDDKRDLTARAQSELQHAFGGGKPAQWRFIKARMTASGLNLPPSANLKDDRLVAAMVAPEAGLHARGTLSQLLDDIVIAELELPPGKVTLDRIKAHLLAKRAHVEAKGKTFDIARRVAAKTVGTATGRAALEEGLVRRWLADDAPAVTTSLQPSRSHPAPADESIFATLVKDAAHSVGPGGRFGDQKVFISAVWDQLHERLDISLEELKQRLLSANRHGFLSLARADLVGAMDPTLIQRSEIEDANSSFHFVIDSGRR